MSKMEKAILVLSGKILDRPFSFETFGALRAGIESDLALKDVVVSRSVVALSRERAVAAPYFLLAGFETCLADEEDMQAAAIMLAEASGANPPDEIVFALGETEPIQILRLMAGRTRRVALIDGVLSEELGANIENAYDVRDVLSKGGVDLSSIALQTWDEWKNNAGANLTISPAPSAPKTATATEAEASGDVDELCQTKPASEYELVIDSAPEWNEALERLLLKNGSKLGAYQTLQVLDQRFPGILNFYLYEKDTFKSILSPQIKLIEEWQDEASTTYLYHASHKEVAPLSDDVVVKTLTFGAAPEQEEEPAVDANSYYEPIRLEEVAEMAEIMRDQCRWSIERPSLVAAGTFFAEIGERDHELDERSKPLNLFRWMKVPPSPLTVDDYRLGERCYEHARRAFQLLDKVVSLESADQSLIAETLQLALNAQCFVKTFCIQSSFDPKRDHVQKCAFKIISKLRTTRGGGVFLENMAIDSELPFERLNDEEIACKRIADEYEARVVTSKERKEYEGKIEWHSKKLQKYYEENPPRERAEEDVNSEEQIRDWNKIVDAVTTLCRDFKEPSSSKFFRENLFNLVENMPDSVEISEEFARVRFAIDSIKELENERARKEFESVAEEAPRVSEYEIAVKKRYGGSKIVFIGGNPTGHIINRLENRFGVEILWEQTDHGDSLDRFNSRLNDPDVKLFLVYIPWCSHKHSLEFAKDVKEAGKDFVRLPKGTGTEKIARNICDQIDLSAEIAEALAEENAEKSNAA